MEKRTGGRLYYSSILCNNKKEDDGCYEDGKSRGAFFRNCCVASVFLAFVAGLSLGVFLPFFCDKYANETTTTTTPATDQSVVIETIFLNNSYGFSQSPPPPTTRMEERRPPSINRRSLLEEDSGELFVEEGIYWSGVVEKALPEGYGKKSHAKWSEYVEKSGVAVKLKSGCGRMQNRMVVFEDGARGCVRYRQNVDQIQGELFSFYLAQILKLPNLAPSAVSVVDLRSPLWRNLVKDVAAAQWNSNKPIVLTEFIVDLDSATIPQSFKPNERHLNRNDLENITKNEISIDNSIKKLVELAQWSDLIIFDYLTANLDRIVNNLYNYQWNANIMDAPAHNLAKKLDNDLLLFLDNESGLLHGYRLLKKYETYHSLLLDNLCLFRKQTANAIRELRKRKNVGTLMRRLFEKRNTDRVKDVLPTLPDKSIRILNERIEKVHEQILKCKRIFSKNV